MTVWEDFERFNKAAKKYLPNHGEGDTIASQICVAVNALVYSWFVNKNVYDNVTSGMTGWCTDLSNYANWLYKYVPASRQILKKVFDMNDSDDEAYSELLLELADTLLDELDLAQNNRFPKIGSVYNCEGIFAFTDLNHNKKEM